jgi:alkylhydroperoxidase family enzyme
LIPDLKIIPVRGWRHVREYRAVVRELVDVHVVAEHGCGALVDADEVVEDQPKEGRADELEGVAVEMGMTTGVVTVVGAELLLTGASLGIVRPAYGGRRDG